MVNSLAARPARRINWRQEYLHITLILMTVCWLVPWLTLIFRLLIEISVPAVLGITAANMLGATLLTRWMEHRRISSGLQTTTILLTMWISAGLTLLILPMVASAYASHDRIAFMDLFYFDRYHRAPVGPVTIILSLLLWWRGFSLGSGYMTLVRASFGVRLGILTFFWAFIAANNSLREEVLGLVPIFFFFGLMSTSLARADSLSLDRRERSGAFGRGWFLSLLGIALAVTLLGYIVALWMSGANLDEIAGALGKIGEVIMTLLFVLLSPLLFLGQGLYNLLDSLISDTPRTPVQTDYGKNDGENKLDTPLIPDFFYMISNVFLILIFVLIVFMLLAFIWFLFFARRDTKDPTGDERESLGTAEVVGGLRNALRNSWRKLADTLGIFRQYGLGRDFLIALTIRRIYARMEKLSEKRGYPRAVSQTPYEYRRDLYQAFPGLNQDIQLITEAYIAVRYGEVPEDPRDLAAVRAAWGRLQESPEPA